MHGNCCFPTGKKQKNDESSQTIQSTDCELLLPNKHTTEKRCHSCDNNKSKVNNKSKPTSHTNYRFLSSPEKTARLKNLHDRTRLMQQNINRLNSQIRKWIEDNGTEVDDDLNKALVDIVEDKSPFVASSYEEGSFPRICWEVQQQASSLKDMRSMRWHPLMIWWCLYLRHLSGRAYEMVRELGVIKLPSQRTLRDYTYTTKAKAGFSSDVDEQLMKAAKLDMCAERDKYVIIIMDEMHIKEGIVLSS